MGTTNLTLMKTVEEVDTELTGQKYLEWLEENYVDDGIYG